MASGTRVHSCFLVFNDDEPPLKLAAEEDEKMLFSSCCGAFSNDPLRGSISPHLSKEALGGIWKGNRSAAQLGLIGSLSCNLISLHLPWSEQELLSGSAGAALSTRFAPESLSALRERLLCVPRKPGQILPSLNIMKANSVFSYRDTQVIQSLPPSPKPPTQLVPPV